MTSFRHAVRHIQILEEFASNVSLDWAPLRRSFCRLLSKAFKCLGVGAAYVFTSRSLLGDIYICEIREKHAEKEGHHGELIAVEKSRFNRRSWLWKDVA